MDQWNLGEVWSGGFDLKIGLVRSSYARKLVMVRSGGVVNLLDPVSELNPFNDLWHAVGAVELSPLGLR